MDVDNGTLNAINSMKYIASKNQGTHDGSSVGLSRYTKEAVEIALAELDVKWGKQYPVVIKSWQTKGYLSAYFKYPDYVRKAIYTTLGPHAVAAC